MSSVICQTESWPDDAAECDKEFSVVLLFFLSISRALWE